MKVTCWPLGRILPYPTNAKTHDVDRIVHALTIGLPENLDEPARIAYLLSKCIDQPIVVDGDGVIIKGHGRRKAAEVLGLPEFPVVVRTDLTPDQVRLARLADNRSSEGGWDLNLAALEVADLDALLADSVELADYGLSDEWLAEADTRPMIDFAADPTDAENEPVAGTGNGQTKVPLAIVLTLEEFAGWQSYKQQIGVQADTKAFLTLLAMR